MRALTVQPGQRDSVRLEQVEDPRPGPKDVLVETVVLGICGTDREITEGRYGQAPAGSPRLVLGHESLGRVLAAPPGAGVVAGDLVAAIVRRPDPVPCSNCAVGEWDMCRNGLYTECGIKGRHGFGAERLCVPPEFLVRLDPGLGMAGVLLEPASVLAKAWEHIEHIGRRAQWRPRKVLVTGAGPVGLLAALLGVQRDLDVHVLDRVTDGPKPDLVRALGATYHTGSARQAGAVADVIVECTGAASVVFDVMQATGRSGIVCLTGLSTGGRTVSVDAGMLNRTIVLENDVVFGSVNANRRHYEQAALALARADRAWLHRLITRRVPLARWNDALAHGEDDVKVVLEFAGLPPPWGGPAAAPAARGGEPGGR